MDQRTIDLALSDNTIERNIFSLISEGNHELLSYALDRMEENNMMTYPYFAGRYELGKSLSEEIGKLLEWLEELFAISYDGKYMLEAAVLYCQAEKVSKARRILKNMITIFPQSEFVEEGNRMLDLLKENGPEAVIQYGKKYFNKTEQDNKKEAAKVFPAEIESEFCNLVGMNVVKEKLYEFYQMNWLAKVRKEKLGLDVEDTKSYNFILYGNPGTGKTTVARILGKILHNLELRGTDEVIETDRSGMVGAYVGHTEENMRKLLDKVKEVGGTLFVDEAYTLYRKEDSRDFGIEAINCLLKDMEDNRGSYSVILAGYKKQMDEMLNEANPGFRSRFTYHIHIPDYSNDELLEIAERISKKQKFVLSQGAKEAIRKRIDKERVDETFANARFITDLMNDAQMKMAIRVANMPNAKVEDLMILRSEDFGILEDGLSANTMDSLIDELNKLTGLHEVKEKVKSLVNSIKVKQEAAKHGINLGDNIGTLHMVFKGSAGTGKTTVARIIGKIYKELGILKRGDVFIECTRADLVGKYQGQTTEKVKGKIKEALGGILFIDEAYSLCKDENDSFGKEAIDTLVADIENYRDKLMVIVAGYSRDMESFLDQNQGLSSRLSTEINFEDYTVNEMVEIFYVMIQSKNRVISQNYREDVWRLLDHASKTNNFGNARGVRNIADTVVRKMDSRVATMMESGVKLSKEDFITVMEEDIRYWNTKI